MPNVIQELAGDDVALSPAHVSQRVQEWKTRLSSLYGEVVFWLPDLTSNQIDTVEMNEELMREYGVPPIQLPVLRLFNECNQVAKFVPRGLWIIGANGRVDLFAAKGQFVIVDRSDYFMPPRWEITYSLKRLETKPLSRDTILQTIR